MFHRLAAGLIAGFFMLALSACAVVDKAAEHAEVSRLGVKAGTLRYIEACDSDDDCAGRAERAGEVRAFVDRAREQVDASRDATVDELVDAVKSEVRWERLEMSEQLLVEELITAVAETLKDKMGESSLSEEDRLRIKAVLDWAYEAAGLYAR